MNGNRFSPYATVVLRFAVGGVFLMHGVTKVRNGLPAVAGFLHGLGIPFATIWAPILTGVETVGAACVVAGILTRFWGFCLAVDMTVAILVAIVPRGGNFELESMLLAGALSLVALGDGPLSLGVRLKRGDG